MKQENGIILLHEIIPNWQKAIQKNIVIPNDLCGPFYNGYWLKQIEEKNWFLKLSKQKGINDSLYIELLAEELARAIGISSISSQIVKYGKNTYGLISESYLTPGYDIVNGQEIIQEYLKKLKKVPTNLSSLEFIWEALDDYFFTYPNKKNILFGILNELTKRYVFSFLIMNRDFHLGNWELYISKDFASLTPLYDMDLSFSKQFDSTKHNSMYANMEQKEIYEDFKEYFDRSDNYFKEEVKRQMSILSPEFILTSIANIEKKYQLFIDKRIKEQLIQTYITHYEKIKQMIERSRMI